MPPTLPLLKINAFRKSRRHISLKVGLAAALNGAFPRSERPESSRYPRET
jgi:hypothetical protein